MATAALMDELIEEVLLRLPPSEPASLVRAAAVCKRWYIIISDPGFRRRFCEFHRAPPTIGIVYTAVDGDAYVTRFRPCAAAFPPRGDDRRSSAVLDCRHGRVLLCDVHVTPAAVVGGEYLGALYVSVLHVWNPVTGDQWEVPLPHALYPNTFLFFDFVVLYAAANNTCCNHHGCHGGPFRVVIMGTDDLRNIFIYDYSSEAAAWREPSSIRLDTTFSSYPMSGLIAGDAVYFILKEGHKILRYDLIGHAISVMNPPPLLLGEGTVTRLVAAKDGGLGIANVENYDLHVWSWRAAGSSNGVGQWVKDQVIKLDMVLSIATDEPLTKFVVFDFGEGTDIVFISSDAGIFAVWLKSGRMMKVDDNGSVLAPMHCYQSFCTPAALGPAPCMSFPASQRTEVSTKREENVTPQVLESQSSAASSVSEEQTEKAATKLNWKEDREGQGTRQRMQRS